MASRQERFIAEVKDAAEAASRATGIDRDVIIAQAAHESAWGASVKGNNYFGIKGKGQSFTTHEYINGKKVVMKQGFRKYANPTESFMDWARLMTGKPRYAKVIAAKTPEDQIAAMGASGYATDPKYASKLASITNRVKNMVGSVGDAIGLDGKFGVQTIRPGQKSEDVKALQSTLKKMGADIEVDGDYGPRTRAAVEMFQRANGLKVDGIVGADTKGMLGAAVQDTVTLEARDASAEAIKAQSAKFSADVEATLASAPLKPVTRGPLPDLPPSVPRRSPVEMVAGADLAPGQAFDPSAQPARAAGDPMSTPNHPAWDNPPPGYYAGSPWWSQPRPGEPGGMPLKDAQLQQAEAARMAAFNRRDMEQPAAMSPASRAEALRQEAIKRTANDPAFNSALLGDGLRGSPEAQPSLRYNAPQGGGLLASSEARPSLRAQTAGANSPFADPRVQSIGNAPRSPDFDHAFGSANAPPSLAQFDQRFGGPANAPQRTVIGNPAGVDMAARRRIDPRVMQDAMETAAARRELQARAFSTRDMDAFTGPNTASANLNNARRAAAMAASSAANAPTRQTAQNMASARAGASAAGAGAVSGMSRPSAHALGAVPGAGPITGAMRGGYNPLAAQSLGRVSPPPPEFYKPVNPLTANPVASAPIPRMDPIAGPAPVAAFDVMNYAPQKASPAGPFAQIGQFMKSPIGMVGLGLLGGIPGAIMGIGKTMVPQLKQAFTGVDTGGIHPTSGLSNVRSNSANFNSTSGGSRNDYTTGTDSRGRTQTSYTDSKGRTHTFRREGNKSRVVVGAR